MKNFLAGLISICTPYILYSQPGKKQLSGPVIQFEKIKHDFGRISEDILYAKVRFYFENTGDDILMISSVQTSCGCTTPDWTRDTVRPGEKGYVEAKYETINRLGTFNKTITVYSNAKNSPFVHLNISGDVYKEKVAADGMAIPDYGKLFFDQPTIEFNPIFDNKSDTQTVRLINSTPFTTNFEPIATLPAYCKILGWPKSLEPNENAKIQIVLDARLIKLYGFGAFEIPMACDNPVMKNLGLYVAYTRKQYFPKLSSKQLAKSPKIKFDKEFHDFGNRATGDVMSTEFKVSNSGKSDLILHEIYPECSCLKLDYDKKILKPGETMIIKVRFDTVDKTGTSNQGIWIVSNDPTRDEMHIYVRAIMPSRNLSCPTCPK